MIRSLLCLTVCSLTVSFGQAIAKEAEQPNIIFVLADDLGYGDLSCFGQEKFSTPNLDRLATQGMRLTQHYAGSTVCAPSRCSLLTGLHTGHCHIRGNKPHRPIGQAPLPDKEITLAELLKEAGYVTGAFGKWGLGYPGSEGEPLNQGFDRFFGYNCQRNAHTYYPEFLYDDREQIELDGKTYSHDLIIEEAFNFIREHQDQPFFCFLPVTIPHASLEVPEESRAAFRKEFSEFEHLEGKYEGRVCVNPIAAFAGMVTHLDRDMGRLANLLEELDLTKRTILIFTSDNGPHHEGGHNPKFFQSSGPWRGIKRDLYEGGIRMPTIVSWPGQVAAGSESDFMSAAWDWLPTFCDLTGTNVPTESDGVSLLPVLTGQGEQIEHDYLYWEFHEKKGKQAIRRGDWKAIRLNVAAGPNGPIELFNLAQDPGEKNNVSAEFPEIVSDLVALMAQARRPSELFPFGNEPKKDNRKWGKTQ